VAHSPVIERAVLQDCVNRSSMGSTPAHGALCGNKSAV
jgi:hypothetical protein